MNLRVSHVFRLVGRARIEAIGEIFNLFNAENPAGFTPTRLLGTSESQPGLPASGELRG